MYFKSKKERKRAPLGILMITALFLLTGAFQSRGCDLCAIYSTTMAQGESERGFILGVAEQFTHFGDLQFEGEAVPDPANQRLDSSITQTIIGYNFNDRFNLQISLPFIRRSFRRPDGFQIEEGIESGLGDVSLLGKFLVLRRDSERVTFVWNLLGGVKLPTGNSDRIEEELNELEIEGAPESGIHGHDLTLGSGSFDGILGTSIYSRYGRFLLTGNLQYAIRSKGDFDYRFANDLTWEVGAGYYLYLEHYNTVTLQANVSGERKDTDTFRGKAAEDTGVTTVFLAPKLTVTWTSRLSAEVEVDFPVMRHNTDLQIVPDYRVRAGLTWRF